MLALVALLATLPSGTSEVAVDVPLIVGADVDDEVLDRALSEVDEIFAPGGIRLRFRIVPMGTVENDTVSVSLLSRPARAVVAGCSRNKHDHRLGHTSFPSQRITLWSEQIVRAVGGDWDRRDLPRVSRTVYARALGRVLAHELGHLFLRMSGHRTDGLMRASFSHGTLTASGNRAFRMSQRDLERMRIALERATASTPSSIGTSR